jgi:phosphoadenosine phosphosulfate reductase
MMSSLCPDIEAVLPLDLFGESPDTRSIAILREFVPDEGYWFADSFGKDSSVLRDLLFRSGVIFEAHHNLTTIDPPELIWFGRKHHPETIIDKPRKSFWAFMRENGLPTRQARWCCRELKERGGSGRRVVVGVRAAESTGRSKYGIVRPCHQRGANGKVLVSPMLHWSTADVWEYTRRREIPYCCLYDEGWHRIGCVLCPFNSQAETNRAVARWPKLFDGLGKAVARVYPEWRGWHKFGSPEAVVAWWLNRRRAGPGADEQMAFDQFGEDNDE